MTTTGIILAAGKGTRMRSAIPKSLHKVAGLPLVGHGIRTMRAAGIEEVVVVASDELAGSPEFREALSPGVRVSIQREQRGTADALHAARSAVSGAGTLVVAPVDMVLVTGETARSMLKAHTSDHAAVTVLGARVDDPAGLGRIKLGPAGQPVAILEEHEADEELRAGNLVNTSWYCFDNSWIWDELDSVTPAETGEVYLPRVIERASKIGHSRVVIATDPETGLGINDRVQLAEVERIVRRRINESHMKNGVTLQDPATTYIDIDVEIGSDTTIGAGTQLGRAAHIGANVIIGPNTQVFASEIGDSATVDGARVIDSTIGKKASVGPNSLIRADAELKPGARVGNQAEIKASVIGSGSHVSHFSYVGDAILGENVNIGAGTVTCNYDGKDKHTTVIEDGALIGSSTMLIAPVTIGKLAKTGAGSVVRNDVAPGDTVAGVPAKSIKSK
ncbi:MAG: bifunctional UDP-N-acetylglucosamine diphosphorylase/glucosamine-1-phosphate N-acetyltransferase GlmU [Dehalococcoidia bacterium]|jgi:bifunctional UDP-N-acetylglucosamine pyrophosphorylase/glucosamine-1-phosphate N-acetyltransferase|nr:bifunctional UDP-N-acetylglucosamine diphosphorylase/glucosamine-1-phosphate N-acetyltransferase GlmU [Dehalococcoidia bacterium]